MPLILVIDDEPIVLNSIRKILERSDFDVLEAVNGKEGLAIFENYHTSIDLAMLDLLLPDKPGEEVLSELRKLSPEVKVLITTGQFIKKTETPEGIVGVIHKPLGIEEMIVTIRDALGS